MILYNTLTKKNEEFTPIKDKEIKMYECGPTVYDFIHIGNARPMCVFDSLRRYFLYLGYNVTFAQNFTDVDDKIINKAKIQNKTCKEIADEFIAEYYTDAQGLNIIPATYAPKATETIENIQKIIQKLCELNMAYCKDGTVYFRAKRFKEYGKLSGMPIDELNAGARVEINTNKEDSLDFALWKAAKPGEIYWPSLWGNGRPGWHIECSAMIDKIFGTTIDIHCGGQDLIFPHHENEIAQSVTYSGVNLANYWLHNGHINISGNKMSKSAGNFFTVREIAQKYGYMPIRLMMLQSHYRTPINYSEEIMAQNLSALERVNSCREALQDAIKKPKNASNTSSSIKIERLAKFKEQFKYELDNDFNTAGALGVLFNMVKEINTTCFLNKMLNPSYVKMAYEQLEEFLYILGLNLDELKIKVELEIQKLIDARQEARKNKDFKTADEIRSKLQELGIILEDTATGVKIKKLGGNKK
ncbi:MAG: cysteine--tRNA ligase [Oscillospiraceae bacterium]|nr:cysteine--tRNA ligase [Oscillospiraceae bacterium]